MAAKPKYTLLYTNYPKQDDPAQVKKLIGGHVDAAWIKNTCAIRLSRALNNSGYLVPAPHPGLATVSGADKMWYAYRMQELKRYLPHFFGQPTLSAARGPGGIDRSTFLGKQGIIAFDIHFADADGHLDLWDGSTFIHEHIAGQDYFAAATKVVLWEGA